MMTGDKQGPLQEIGQCSEITLSDIVIDETSILRIQGYRDFDGIRLAIKKAATDAARDAEKLICPKIYYRIQNVEYCCGEILKLESGAAFKNEAFERFLKKARQIAVFILTMGHPLDNAVIESSADDQLLRALFLESAGWLGIEGATRTLSVHLRAEARKRGCRLSPRLGPGYSYKLDGRLVSWPLEQQLTLFQLFKDDVIDVDLLESCAMRPKFSRSGLFGFLADP